MEFKVIDKETGADITHKHTWVMRPNGDLYYLILGRFMEDPCAVAVSTKERANNEQ